MSGRRALQARAGSLAVLVAFLGAWYLAAQVNLASDRLLPGPEEVAAAAWQLLGKSYFYTRMWESLSVIVGGFIGAAVLAVAMATLLSLSAWIRRGVYPVVVGANTVPLITLIPLILVTFGRNQTSRILIVTLAAFFPVFLSTLTGLSGADRPGVDLLRSLGASRLQELYRHAFPQALPAIFAGLKISLTVAFIVGIVAELLIGAEGLGFLIHQFETTLQIDYVFALTLIVALLGAGLFFAVAALERKVVFWAPARLTELRGRSHA